MYHRIGLCYEVWDSEDNLIFDQVALVTVKFGPEHKITRLR